LLIFAISFDASDSQMICLFICALADNPDDNDGISVANIVDYPVIAVTDNKLSQISQIACARFIAERLTTLLRLGAQLLECLSYQYARRAIEIPQIFLRVVGQKDSCLTAHLLLIVLVQVDSEFS